jgi:hypothetical protein
MKKYLFTLLFFAIAAAASAQVGKGQFYIGGSLNYNYDEAGTSSVITYPQGTTYYNNGKVTNFQLSPDFGFFLTDKWAIGIQLGYTRTSGTETNQYVAADNTSTSFNSTDKYSTDALGIGIHLRYYCMFTDKFGFFPQFGVTTSNNLKDFNTGTLSIGGNPNFVFFPTKHLGINLGFGNLAYNMDYKTKDKNFNLGLNTNIGFGLNYYW